MTLRRWRMGLTLAFACAGASPLAAKEFFETWIGPAPLTNGTRANVTGEGRVRATLDGNKLDIDGDYQGLQSNATTAQLYVGQVIGALGPKAFDLSVTAAVSGKISGTVALSAGQAAALRAGKLYVLVNSEKAPDGNLIGWLLPPHPFAGEDVPVSGHGFLPQLDVPHALQQ